MPQQIQNFYFLETIFTDVSEMSYLAANFEICSVKITLVIKSQIYNGRRLVSRIRR